MNLKHAMAVVYLIERGPAEPTATWTAADIAKEMRVSRATVFRLIADVADELGVKIDLDGAARRYVITTWGIIDRDYLMPRGPWYLAGLDSLPRGD